MLIKLLRLGIPLEPFLICCKFFYSNVNLLYCHNNKSEYENGSILII